MLNYSSLSSFPSFQTIIVLSSLSSIVNRGFSLAIVITLRADLTTTKSFGKTALIIKPLGPDSWLAVKLICTWTGYALLIDRSNVTFRSGKAPGLANYLTSASE